MLKITPYLGIIVMIISLWRNLLPKARVLLAAGLCQPDGHCSIQGQVVLRQPLSARKLCRLLARPDKPKGQNSVDLKKHVNRDTNLHRHGIYDLPDHRHKRNSGQGRDCLCDHLHTYDLGCHFLRCDYSTSCLVLFLPYGHTT